MNLAELFANPGLGVMSTSSVDGVKVIPEIAFI